MNAFASGAINKGGRPKRPLAGIRQLAAAILLTALALAWIAAGHSAHAQTVAQPRLPIIELRAGIHLIRAEVAASERTRAAGLMFRERLGPNEGMLFVFQSEDRQCFWMRNTPLALSIAFIDSEGRIVNIEDMQPRTDDGHCSARPVSFALEMEQGWFRSRGVEPGSRIAGLPGVFGPR
jgi:uncharacterized membrane protein (UPF0127 family)